MHTENFDESFKSMASQFRLLSVLDKKITELSSGEYQRVCLIRALIRNKPIIILDEPVAFLDSENKKTILETLLSLNKKGVTILFSSHNQEDFKFFKTHIPKNLFVPYSLSTHEKQS